MPTDAAIVPVQPSTISQMAAGPQAPTDGRLIELWIHGRSPHSQRAYTADARRFLAHVGRPLAAITLADLQEFADSLGELAPSSQARVLSAVKSLLTFGHKTGYLAVNVGAALRLPKRKDRLAERILSEAAVQKMLAKEDNPRNHALLRLLYGAGVRASEICSLRWRDCQARQQSGQVTVFGKGGKTRHVLLSAETWAEVLALRGSAGEDAPVFAGRRGQPLSTSQVWRIVKSAAAGAGLSEGVSPHWLRHAHASHAIDRGAPISLVQATLGHASTATTGRYLHARPDDSSARYLAV